MQSDKKFVTLVSVVAAVFLTSGKLVVGLLTGSLGLLSEAAHSGMDFIASVVTFFAVRVSDKPADLDHAYGHGKIENLSALLEAGLLFLACAWIVYEAIGRIFFHTVTIEANVWAFGVILSSIVIDFWRSRALRRAARKYGSQAMEADALNFTMDMWSSGVVLLGLCLVKYGEYVGQPEKFEMADAIAALAVTVLLMSVTARLAKRAVDVLMDRAPRGVQQKVEEIARSVDGVLSVHQVRARPSGNRVFIDLHVCVARNMGFEASHQVAENVETAVRAAVKDSDVTVHADPRPEGAEGLAERVRAIAANQGVPIHDLHLHNQDGKLHLDLDLEVDANLSLDKAHTVSRHLEQTLRSEIPEVDHVHSHIEPRRPDVERTDRLKGDTSVLVDGIKETVRGMTGVVDCHAVEIERIEGDEFVVSLHCTFEKHTRIEDVHRAASDLERVLKSKYPTFRRVLVHTEPSAKKPSA